MSQNQNEQCSKMAAEFHPRVGALVSVGNNGRTAERQQPTQEFNNGLVFGRQPLRDGEIFEVRLDRKVNSWSGSIEVGVTTIDPDMLDFPTSATGLREGSWIVSGCSILKDGRSIRDNYGADLDTLAEGDCVGVQRKADGDLHIFVNGEDSGVAATGLPQRVWPVIDMYGKCCQITLMETPQANNNDSANNAVLAENTPASNDSLRFHERCGALVKLTNQGRSAERRRPLDEFNNGVVITTRAIRDNEMFEVRIDRLVDKWSGSIEMGITTHNPATLEFPATMTNMRSGTIMMSGGGVLTNGRSTLREYGEFNLDELTEGDVVGLMRKSNGNLHFYVNGLDQGLAAQRTPCSVYGVVDLYGMTVKVTLVDPESPHHMPLSDRIDRRANRILQTISAGFDNESVPCSGMEESEKILFHPKCGSHAAVINGGRTALRPNALEDFNNGVILTTRPLRTLEMFTVRIDKMVDKWAGSIEIGLTSHTPPELEFPSTMTNVRSGTWMMTGNGIMHNGTTVLDEYGHNLDRLKVNDRVGVMRKQDGTLHFYVNGVDQGVAAQNVPDGLFSVVDLYGQAAQATIVDMTEDVPPLSSDSDTDSSDVEHNRIFSPRSPLINNCVTEELRFHHLHGRNATITNNGRTASRPNARGEFNDAIIMSNRALQDNELFEVVIEKMVDRWSGSIEAGLTAIRPDDLEFPNTMTDIDYDTWMLSGSAVMQDGSTIRNGYQLDLDTLTGGSRLGMMRTSNGEMHFFVNGVDQGVACTDVPPGIYAVIDLYGQCAQVSITSGSENSLINGDLQQFNFTSPLPGAIHRFHQNVGKNVVLKNNSCTATRIRNFNHGLMLSSKPLRSDELFEIRIEQTSSRWSGSLQIGLSMLTPYEVTPTANLPPSAIDLRSKVTWVMSGSSIKRNGLMLKENYAPTLDRLEVGGRVGVKRCTDGTMHIVINGEDMGVAANSVPKDMYAVVDLYGRVEQVTVISSSFSDLTESDRPPSISSTSTESLELDAECTSLELVCMEFHWNHGKNIQLINDNMTACRTASYNQGIVVSRRPLPRMQLFQVRVDKLNPRWTSSLLIGVVGQAPDKLSFPLTAVGIKKSSWIIQGNALFNNSVKVREQYGPNLDSLHVGHLVGVMVDLNGCFHLFVNGVDQGVAAHDIPVPCYVVIDLYGQCEQITIIRDDMIENDNREKADMVDGMKESVVGSPPITPAVVRNCEYKNLCTRFKSCLGLPEGYFNPEPKYNLCYCETCHKLRGDEPYVKRGDPPRDYALPFGWSRFALRLPPRAEMLNVFEKWHVAFHGTSVAAIRKILDSGELLIPGNVQPGDIMMTGRFPLPEMEGHLNDENKPQTPDVTQIFLSPTVKYAGHDAYARRYKFTDPKTKTVHYARVAFQVCIRPGCYQTGPQTIGANEPIDPKFDNNEIEWFTKERGATVLYGLLIKIE
ncbi:neuralized-like protein 4 isoform X1 [Branchiostoma lanceolatum]|uniref:neuralized-like protein 4 isoform X1 n=1 Tax=Branchiostoma lanceolatum TaxID=7740 RepID=UPI003451F3C8